MTWLNWSSLGLSTAAVILSYRTFRRARRAERTALERVEQAKDRVKAAQARLQSRSSAGEQ